METVRSPIKNEVSSVFIHVTDLKRSAEWYSMVMGLPLLEKRLNGGPVYWMKLEGGAGIVLDNHSNEPDEPRVLFNYTTTDIDASYRFVHEKGADILCGIKRPHDGLAYFSFGDPDGNAIMVVQSDYDGPVIQRLEHTESPILNKIGGIFVHVTDMGRAVKFHREVLGLPFEAGPEPSASIYDLPMQGGSGVLLDANRFLQGDDYKALFMFVTHDVDASRRYLAANGVKPFIDIERHGAIAFLGSRQHFNKNIR